MQCPVCTAAVSAEALFCQHCGAKLSSGHDASSTKADVRPADPATSTANPAAAMGRRRVVADVPEETLWEGSYSPKAMIGSILLALFASVALVAVAAVLGGQLGALGWILAGGAALVVWLIVAAQFVKRRIGVHYKMTNQMFYHRRGVMTRTIDRIEAIDIDDVTWTQGFVERMLNVGSIKISSRDRTDPVFWLRGIDEVEAVARLIDKARRAERLRRGFLSIEQTNVDLGT